MSPVPSDSRTRISNIRLPGEMRHVLFQCPSGAALPSSLTCDHIETHCGPVPQLRDHHEHPMPVAAESHPRRTSELLHAHQMRRELACRSKMTRRTQERLWVQPRYRVIPSLIQCQFTQFADVDPADHDLVALDLLIAPESNAAAVQVRDGTPVLIGHIASRYGLAKRAAIAANQRVPAFARHPGRVRRRWSNRPCHQDQWILPGTGRSMPSKLVRRRRSSSRHDRRFGAAFRRSTIAHRHCQLGRGLARVPPPHDVPRTSARRLSHEILLLSTRASIKPAGLTPLRRRQSDSAVRSVPLSPRPAKSVLLRIVRTPPAPPAFLISTARIPTLAAPVNS